MANQLLSMSKIKSILRLLQQGISKRKIAERCRTSRKTIDKYEVIFNQHPLSHTELLRLSDKELFSVIAPPAEHEVGHDDLYNLFPHYEQELKRIGVTKLLLWESYKETYPEGVQYSQFCEHFRRYLKSQQLSYVHEHKAGDKLMVDFAGKKLHLTDMLTGELVLVNFFVGILPCSGLTYGQACMSTQGDDFIDCIQNCLSYIGGVTNAIVTDNLKPAVNKASKYDPEINRSMADLASHYNLCVLPTRAYKPKDKALVEGAVNILYTRVYAPLRDQIFYSLAQLNEAIRKHIDEHNRMLFQEKEISRLDQFNAVEKLQLKTLPITVFLSKKYQTARVHPNCHAMLTEDKHHYSVPYTYVSKEVEISYDNDTVEIYYKLDRIATHTRARKKHNYTTLKEHLHPRHQYYQSWSEEFFLDKGHQIGNQTSLLMTRIFNQVQHPEQAYKLCQGVLQLAKKYGFLQMENASQICIQYDLVSYKRLENILVNYHKLEQMETVQETPIIQHENIRGDKYYNSLN